MEGGPVMKAGRAGLNGVGWRGSSDDRSGGTAALHLDVHVYCMLVYGRTTSPVARQCNETPAATCAESYIFRFSLFQAKII